VDNTWEEGLGGKRGVVFVLLGEPVRGGAEGLGGAGGVRLEESFKAVGMGLVTAVDQAGGTFVTGAGSNWPEVPIEGLATTGAFGFGGGVISVDGGLTGLGGRLMRRVSRLGAFGSDP
jgi:hypothetical protein